MLETICVTLKHEQVLTEKAVYTIVEKVPSNGDDTLFSAALIVSSKPLTERDYIGFFIQGRAINGDLIDAYLFYDGCFCYYEKRHNKCYFKWMAKDLMHLYMELSELDIDSVVLTKFLKKTKIL